MLPTLRPGQLVILLSPCTIRPGDVVMFSHSGREKIKRISELTNTIVYLLGDNAFASTDSRHFGWVPEKTIIAKLMWPRHK